MFMLLKQRRDPLALNTACSDISIHLSIFSVSRCFVAPTSLGKSFEEMAVLFKFNHVNFERKRSGTFWYSFPVSAKWSCSQCWHSTETSLIHTTDTILNAIDEKKTTAMVLLDMSKAFDSISHKILLYKLQDLGASTSAIDWFSSYLSNRTQVLINTKISDPLPLTSEVPQGSILGPILFGIYVNDLPSIPRNCLTEC